MRQPIQVLIYPARHTANKWEYLLLRRTPMRGGYWQGVTGGVEQQEDAAATAKRELFEETRLNPTALLKTDFSYSYPIDRESREFYSSEARMITELVFVAILPAGVDPIIDPLEHDDWKWCKLDEAFDLLEWKYSIEALRRSNLLLGSLRSNV